jgi:hypothetical protein
VARRGAPKPNALVAAATNIRLADPKVAEKQAARRQDWQAEAWAYFDEVPELKEAIRYRGNQLAKLRLYVATANPNDPEGDPIPVTDEASGVPPQVAAEAVAELGRLRAVLGGQAEILRELDMNLEVAGECYLVGMGERTVAVKQRDGSTQDVVQPEDWQIRSVAEVLVKDGRYFIKDSPSDTKGTPLDPELDTIIRIWTRHPQWSNLPDCAMRGLLGECRALQVLSQQVLAEANSRQSAGAFTVPNELSFGPADPTQPADGEDAEDQDPFMAELQKALTEPIADPSAASSVMPMLIRGPAEFLKDDYLRRIDFARDTSQALEARIEARIARIARGINLPVEKVMGHQQTTYANAAQVDEDEFNDYLRPSADTGVEALTYAFLCPQLLENPLVPPEWADGRLFVHYDPAGLIAQPNAEANADTGLKEGAISEAAWRKAKGFSEDDAPDVLELLVRAGLRRGILTADLTLALLQLLEGAPPIEVTQPADVPEGEEPPPEDPDADARAALLQLLVANLGGGAQLAHVRANGNGHVHPEPPAPLQLTAAPTPVPDRASDAGRRLTELDRELRTRLVVASNDAMNRALERAGNRLRSKANGTELRSTLRSVPPRLAFAHLGQTLVAQVLGDDDPLDGAWDDLEAQFMAWGGQAQGQAIDVAGQVASGFTAAERQTLGLRQADDLAEAWAWMREALSSLAVARMFDPDPAVPTIGEFDPSLRVPTGLVRQAMARAGGATGLVATDDGGTWITLTDGGTRPAGGIGTGELVRGALRDGGAMVEAYRWVYGPAFRQRPFVPHMNLDGQVFRNFDDPVLANGSGWPPYSFYMPGDHAGCICDFEPIIVPAAELS